MSAAKPVFVCRECGYESAGWLGKCPSCNQWSTFDEELRARSAATGKAAGTDMKIKAEALSEITADEGGRITTGIREMDRVLGGGMVKGSLVLVGGDPGIGKSTLMLQICEKTGIKIRSLYVSGEESSRQIKLRADRLGIKNTGIKAVSETAYLPVENLIRNEKPDLVIIDSIQTMYDSELSSSPGSVSQVREVTAGLMRLAKSLGTVIMIVGHVTKEGAIAGPRVLEHIVDTVLYFEGERHLNHRILRAVKNRFGSTNEIGIFEMRDSGLEEIGNASMVFLSGRSRNVPGSAIAAGLEGTRPILMEIQALVCPTSFGMPRRMATGADYNRITLLMAVLEKRMGMQLHNYDAYVNVAGGLRIEEPACDLAIISAIASSFRNMPLDPDAVFIGEVGLTGEIRAVSQIDKRINEAARMGFKSCFIPEDNEKTAERLEKTCDISIRPVHSVQEVVSLLL